MSNRKFRHLIAVEVEMEGRDATDSFHRLTSIMGLPEHPYLAKKDSLRYVQDGTIYKGHVRKITSLMQKEITDEEPPE